MPNITYNVDPAQVINALKLMNDANSSWEKGSVGANDKVAGAFQRVGDLLLKINDRHLSSLEKITQAVEKQAVAYGKTGPERLIAQRDALIKKLGDEEGMVVRVTAAYDKMIKAASAAGEPSGPSGGRFKEFGENITNFIEQPMQAAKGAVTGLLEKMGPIGSVVAGGVTVLAAFATAAYEAAKSLGEWGVRIADVQMRTGLSTKAIGEFDYAAKAVGSDIDFTERTMRGLAMSLEATGTQGDKARDWAQKFGLDLRGIKDGTADYQETLMKLGKGLEELPAGFGRTEAAIALLKRQGLSLVPVLVELNENVETAKRLGFGFSEEEAETARHLNAEVAKLDRYWSDIKRNTEWFILSLAGISKYDSVFDRFEKFQAQQAGLTDKKGVQPADAGMKGVMAGLGLTTGVSNAQMESDLRSRSGLEAQLPAARKAAKEASDAYFDLHGNMKATRDEIQTARQAWLDKTSQVDHLTAAVKALDEATKNAAKSGVFVARPVNEEEQAQKFDLAFNRGEAKFRGAPSLISSRERIQQLPIQQTTFDAAAALKDALSAAKQAETEQEAMSANILRFREQIVKLQTGPGGELEAAQKIFDLRMGGAKTDLDSQKAILDLVIEQTRIQIDADKKHAEQLKKQTDSIKTEAEGLFHTLFTDPSKFGSQLASKLKGNLLKPIEEGLGGLTANVLRPVVFGASGEGGISGGWHAMFGGKQDPVKIATDMNTGATVQNSAVIAGLTAVLAAGMGIAAPSVPAGTGGAGISMPSISAPSISGPIGAAGGGGGVSFSVPSPFGPIPIPFAAGISGQFGGGGGGFGGVEGVPAMSSPGGGGASAWPDVLRSLSGGGGGGNLAGLIGPGGTSGFTGAVKLGGGTGTTTTAGKGYGGMFGGLRSIFSSATSSGIQSNIGGYLHPINESYSTGSAIGNLATGPASGTAAAGMVTSGGIALAEHGLLGNWIRRNARRRRISPS
jgi:hypothetical protein